MQRKNFLNESKRHLGFRGKRSCIIRLLDFCDGVITDLEKRSVVEL